MFKSNDFSLSLIHERIQNISRILPNDNCVCCNYCEFQKFEFFPEKGTDPPPNPSSRSAHDIPTVYGPTLDTNVIHS